MAATYVVGVLILLSCCAACAATPPAEPHTHIAIATGGKGGAFHPMGKALALLYSERLPDTSVTLLTGGSSQNVDAVESGQAAFGFTQADIAYVAYRRGTQPDARPYSDLRGVALLWLNTVHVAVRHDSRINSVADLRGRRVAVGTRGSGTETLARIVLESYGLTYDDIEARFLPFTDMVTQMRRNEIHAVIVVGGLPADTLIELGADPGVRMIPIPRDQVRQMRAQYPFLQPLTVAAGTYPSVGDVDTLGVSSLLISNTNVPEELVYRMTKELFRALPRLSEAHPAVSLIDPEQAPATPIPLHPGAARYYREHQLTR
jgi:TRAP transporter TAXI family solute receptor